MAKLSETFLHLLGNTLKGLSYATPIGGAMDEQAKHERLKAESDRAMAENARQNVSTLASLSSNYNARPADFVGPHPEGSFQVPPDQGSLVGLTPGTTFEPVQKSEVLPTRDIKTGAITTQEIPIPRGGTVSTAGLKMGNQTPSIADVTLENASPTDLSSAQALVSGNNRPSDFGFRERGRIVALANLLAKSQGVPFQSYSGDVKLHSAIGFSTGKLGQNALSLNTALGHVSSAYDAYKNMENTDVNLLNQPLNLLKKNSNDPNVVKLGITLNALRGELANVFKNSGGTDQEIASWKDYLNENLTPTQVNGALPQIDELLRSRHDALQYQQHDVMDNSPSQRTLLSPKASKTSKKFNLLGQGQGTSSGWSYVGPVKQ